MALSADFHGWRLIPRTGELSMNGSVTGADTFYKGACLSVDADTAVGTVELDNANVDQAWGICENRLVATAAGDLVTGWVRGVFWLTGNTAGLVIVNHGLTLGETAGSDDPADLVISGIGTCGAMGTLLHVEVTAVSGYIDLSQRSLIINA